MSLTSVEADKQDALGYLEEETDACWRATLEAAFGSASITLPAPDSSASPEDCAWFTCDFSPAQFGGLRFGLDRTTAHGIGHLLLSAKGRASEHDHHALHAITHLLGQLGTSLARSLAARLNTHLVAKDCSPAIDIAASPDRFTIPIGAAQGRNYSLIVCPLPSLVSAVANSSASAAGTAVTAASRSAPRNLDVLLDLEMPVSVSFGATRLALKDVARLTTGSIVELNRALSEPVDIIVNNCAIARGEVVVIDGNFAVRIKQVMSKQDRLRSLS
ncbi:MAG TPA: flagellar motor switch protein FliN [Bryobacteraceae bacterium]|jgi:flagellar motor switch protein FliN/FliY|nr:flagellar motor switch protein FliN [Bryobacteraceae bacterium]